jgi:hypothetical protein
MSTSAFSDTYPAFVNEAFAEERFGPNAPIQCGFWYINGVQCRLHPVRGEGISHLNQLQAPRNDFSFARTADTGPKRRSVCLVSCLRSQASNS